MTSDPQDIAASCPVCGGAIGLWGVPYLNPDYIHTTLFDRLTISVCGACGFGFVPERIEGAELHHFYEAQYRALGSPMALDFTTVLHTRHYDERCFAQVTLARFFCDFRAGDVFCDIGPGPGLSFAAATVLLDRPQLAAVELAPEAAAFYCRTFPGIATLASIEELGEQQAKMILMSHSLEHFTAEGAPAALSELRPRIAPGGVLIVEVPYADFRGEYLRLRRWDAPHLCFFSAESLRRLVQDAGFRVLYCERTGDDLAAFFSGAVGRRRPMVERLRAAIPDAWIGRLRYLKDMLYPVWAAAALRHDQYARNDDGYCLRLIAVPA